MSYSFDGPSVYRFHAKVPTNINEKEYELNTGGAITVLADDMSNLSMPVQIEIEKIGRNRWIKITQEGKNVAEFLI